MAGPWSQSGQGSLESQKYEEPGSECVCGGQKGVCLLGRGRVGFLLLYFLLGDSRWGSYASLNL